MDTDRGFELALLAVSGVLTFLLLVPYARVILAAILLAYVLSTPYDWLAPRIGDRVAALALIVGTLGVLLVPLVLLTNVVITGIGDILAALREDGGLAGFEGIDSLLTAVFGIDVTDGSALLELVRRGEVLDLVGTALEALGGLSAAFVRLTILLFVWYYLLKDGDRLLAWIGTVLPLSQSVRSDLYARADDVMYVVVIGNFVVAVIDGVLVGVGLWLAGFSAIVFWTFIAVFLALIPLVGTMLIWIPAAAYLVVIGEVVPGVLLFLYGFLVVGAVDELVRPFLGAPEVGLEPAIFVVGVLTGLTLFGVVGLFYGPVLLVMTKVVYETIGRDLESTPTTS